MFPCDCFFCRSISILHKPTVIWIHTQQIDIHASAILNKLVLKLPLLQQTGIKASGSLFHVGIVYQIYFVVFLAHLGFLVWRQRFRRQQNLRLTNSTGRMISVYGV